MVEDPTTEPTFVLPPPIPGTWTTLADEMCMLFLARFDECDFRSVGMGKSFLVRVIPLEFWSGWVLCDIQALAVKAEENNPVSQQIPVSIHSFVYGPDGFTPLDGKSAVIHEHNARHGLDISTPESQHSYLRFFCYFVRGENGPFEILEDVDRLAGQDLSAFDRNLLGLAPEGGKSATKEDGSETYKASIVYGDTLFNALLALHRSGMVEMLEDDPIMKGVHTIPSLRFVGTARSPSTTSECRQ